MSKRLSAKSLVMQRKYRPRIVEDKRRKLEDDSSKKEVSSTYEQP